MLELKEVSKFYTSNGITNIGLSNINLKFLSEFLDDSLMYQWANGALVYNIKFLDKNINQQIIDKAFDDLYKLDKDIKLGFVDKNIGFELFILNFGGK